MFGPYRRAIKRSYCLIHITRTHTAGLCQSLKQYSRISTDCIRENCEILGVLLYCSCEGTVGLFERDITHLIDVLTGDYVSVYPLPCSVMGQFEYLTVRSDAWVYGG